MFEDEKIDEENAELESDDFESKIDDLELD